MMRPAHPRTERIQLGHSQASKQATHRRLLEVAARRFREDGLDGLSIGDLMTEAGLTRGGFYKHFPSRDALVTEAMGMALESAADAGSTALPPFIDAYLSPQHKQAIGSGCALAALIADAPRAPQAARTLYGAQVEKTLQRIARHFGEGAEARTQALVTFTSLIGALGLARAVEDEALAEEILATVRAHLIEGLEPQGS